MEKKSYSKPIMTAEAFEPQEYIAGCYRWELPLVCTGGAVNGDHWVFDTTDPHGTTAASVGEVTHPGHVVTPPLTAMTEDNNPPSGQYLLDILATVGEFPGAMGNDTNTNGHNPRRWMIQKEGEYQVGYAWYTNGELHFHEGEMEWILVHSGTGSGPNAS